VESTKDTRIFRDKNFVGFERLLLSNVYQIQSFEFQMRGLSNAFKQFEFHCSGKFLGKPLACKCQMLFNVILDCECFSPFQLQGGISFNWNHLTSLSGYFIVYSQIYMMRVVKPRIQGAFVYQE
jgi:hypothetical protein